MAPQRIPGVPYASPPRTESAAAVLSWPPRLIVVHDTGNPTSTKEGEARYASTRPLSGATSAHAYIDNGGVLGSLRLDRQAWAAYSYANRNGLHLEMCLTGDRPTTWRITAALVRQLCQMADIPMVKLAPGEVAAGKRGVCGHWDITTGLGVGDHTDPGKTFPWAQFMAWVNTSTNLESDVNLTDSVTIPTWDQTPEDWNAPVPASETQNVATILGGLHRRVYLLTKGLGAVDGKVGQLLGDRPDPNDPDTGGVNPYPGVSPDLANALVALGWTPPPSA